jgi:hypothetical protein
MTTAAVGLAIYLGFATVDKTDFTTSDADIVALAVAATFVSVMVAQRPGLFT